MERWQTEDNLTHLVNVETLLGKLGRTPNNAKPQEKEPHKEQILLPYEIKWPREVLSTDLKDKLDDCAQNLIPSYTAMPPQLGSRFSSLTKAAELLVKDVMASRDRLLALNPGRRKMIERRLEFIGRKIARSRGEKLNRSLSLPEILKDSYREAPHTQTKLGYLAWKDFVTEVALYHVLELFFLKSLDVHGWRPFEVEDLGRMNFAAHNFLNQRATGFAHDKHCWNFVRTNLYSWHVPSRNALGELEKLLSSSSQLNWSDQELVEWVSTLPAELKPSHFEFDTELKIGQAVLDLLENQLGMPLVSNFQGRPICKKFFIPALELGGVAISFLERMLTYLGKASPHSPDGGLVDEGSQLHRALWACESESFEVFWTEVLALLKVIRSARGDAPSAESAKLNSVCLYRLPQSVHIVHNLGLELHNMDQLPLGGAEVSKLHQGSAAQIQQLETFDVAIVTDHLDRAKSARWMKALAEQLPYWRTLVGNSTNLNWGELHLSLALSKLKENGYCLYLSHRVLPEGGDGEKLRKSLLSNAMLEYFVELNEESYAPYRYLYVFKRTGNKLERDQHRPKFGQIREVHAPIDLSTLEEANSTQAEIAERGWDHLFVRGAAPLIRHLNHKFPKLFQIASIQSGLGEVSQSLFAGSATRALEISSTATGLKFTPLCDFSNRSSVGSDKLFVFPHNPVDLPWIECLLNSAPAQFWIRHQVLTVVGNKAVRLQELRSCPIVDLSHAPTDSVHEALEWMGETKPDMQTLQSWACRPGMTLVERHAKYVAMAKRHASLERIVTRYRPLFSSQNFEQIKPEAITQFYPASLLCHLSQSPEIRVVYTGRTHTNLVPENWILTEPQVVTQQVAGKPTAFVIAHTRQGPSIQILVPSPIKGYLSAQLQALKDYTWGEAFSLLRVPRDIPLFIAQTSEITRVVCDTAREMATYSEVLEELALELFEISHDVRQFLPH